MSHIDSVRWRDDQITAALRDLVDGDHEPTTMDVVRKVFACKCGASSSCRHYSRIYSRLRWLAERGTVVWHGWGDGPSYQVTTWRLAATEPAAAVAALEDMWVQS